MQIWQGTANENAAGKSGVFTVTRCACDVDQSANI